MRGFLFIGALGAIICTTSSAGAYTQAQNNVLDHVAEGLAVAQLCNELSLNDLMANTAFALYHLDVKDPRVAADLMRRVGKKMKDLAGYKSDIVCASGRMLYGSNGLNVRNLLVPKKN